MAALTGVLLSSVLEKSPAEKALTPWWNRIQDYIVFGLIIVCKFDVKIHLLMMPYYFTWFSISASITLPKTLALGTSLDCVPCTTDLCTEESPTVKYSSSSWIRKYCTFESGAVDPIVLFYPLILVIIPSIMYFSERSFQVKLLHLTLTSKISSETIYAH